MAKIDVTSIEGYAEMSAEEKLNALENFEFEAPKVDDKEILNLKGLISKRNSEINKLQDELKAHRTAEENAIAESKAEMERILAENAEFKKASTINGYTAKLLASGYDPEVAKASASALADGDMETFFANLSTVTENISKSALAKAMDSQKGLSVGNPPSQADLDKASQNARRQAMGLPPI